MQKPSEKLGDDRERGKGGSKMSWLRCSRRDMAFTCKAGRSAGKGDVTRELSGNVGGVAWDFLPRYLLPWREHLSFLT